MSNTYSAAPPVRVDIIHGAVTNVRILVALFFREAALKFGTNIFSYIWTLVEPSAFTAIYLLVRIFVKDQGAMIGDNSALFLLTGVVVCRAVRFTIARAMAGIRQNLGLFEFGAIRPIDVITAKVTLEFTIWLLIFAAFMVSVSYIDGEQVLTNYQGAVLAGIMCFYFSFAMSMFNATVGALVPIYRSLWKLATMPMYLASGVLFVPAQLPPDVLNIVWWNPFLHCVEGIRENSYLDYISVYSPTYLGTFSTIVLLIAVAVEHIYRKDILRSRYEDDEDEGI